MIRNSKRRVVLAMLAALTCSGSLAHAQAYPNQPVRIILPTPPGIGPDLFLRKIAPILSDALHQPVLVENRPGASGVVGAQAVASASPDGHTLLFAPGAELLAVKYTLKNPPFDPMDLTPITAAMGPILFYVARPGLPTGSLQELLAHARANPGKLTYGTSGTGSPFHLIGEAVNRQAGVDILHVPYKGTLPAIQDMLGGQIDIGFGSLGGIGQHFRSGALRPMAVAGSQRARQLPDVTTLAEVLPGIQLPPDWFAFWGPSGMPEDVVQRLNREILAILARPDIQAWMYDNGLYGIGSSAQELSRLRQTDADAYVELMRNIALQPQ